MLLQEKFISTSELQQNVSKTIDKAKHEDVIIIRNNKLEAAIISIEKYNQFLEYLEWKKLSDALNELPAEYVSMEEGSEAMKLLALARKERKYSAEDIEKVAENNVEYDKL